MFGDRERMRQRLQMIVERFRQKGATSPEKAMTVQELGLPPRFEQAMHRRLGRLGIFVETNGKYYLDEQRLSQVQEHRAKTEVGNSGGSGWNRSHPSSWSRMLGLLLMLPIGLIIAFAVIYFSVSDGGWFPGEFLLVFIVIFLVLFAVRMLYWSSRRRYWQQQ